MLSGNFGRLRCQIAGLDERGGRLVVTTQSSQSASAKYVALRQNRVQSQTLVSRLKRFKDKTAAELHLGTNDQQLRQPRMIRGISGVESNGLLGLENRHFKVVTQPPTANRAISENGRDVMSIS